MTSTQVAAIFAASIMTVTPCINFAGLLVPVSTLSGVARVAGIIYPAGYFTQISLGTYTMRLGMAEVWPDNLVLLAFAIMYVAFAATALRKQEA